MKTKNKKIAVFLFTTFFLGGCSSAPEAEPFVADWEFVDRPGVPTKACLSEDDVAKLREALIRCRAGNPN